MFNLRDVSIRRQLLLAIAGLLLWPAPGRAIDEVVVEMPLLQSSFSVHLNELTTPEALRQGSSDLAELDRASNGELGRKLLRLLNEPVPVAVRQAADASVGSPLLEQILLLLSSFGSVEGIRPDLSGASLKAALDQAAARSSNGQPSLLALIQALPGERVRLNLGQAQRVLLRMKRQRLQAERLLATVPAAVSAPSAVQAPVQRNLVALEVSHRQTPLELLVLQPSGQPNGRLVLISHGLWDIPQNFEGWGQTLAAHGYTVVLPRHPGSDAHQQQAVLTGRSAPPSAAELGLRARDLIAVTDAVAAGQLRPIGAIDVSRVVVMGHSWGGTTALQLAGVKPEDAALRQRCDDVDDPNRNLSWSLQCSWISGVDQAALSDPRVIAVGAVSPPVSLLFPRGSGAQIHARILLVSGSHDWVVPPDPEAVEPFRYGKTKGHQLVLVQGGDHFNLRPGADATGGVLGPLLVQWADGAFAAGSSIPPAPGAAPIVPPGAWGSANKPMADVSNEVPNP